MKTNPTNHYRTRKRSSLSLSLASNVLWIRMAWTPDRPSQHTLLTGTSNKEKGRVSKVQFSPTPRRNIPGEETAPDVLDPRGRGVAVNCMSLTTALISCKMRKLSPQNSRLSARIFMHCDLFIWRVLFWYLSCSSESTCCFSWNRICLDQQKGWGDSLFHLLCGFLSGATHGTFVRFPFLFDRFLRDSRFRSNSSARSNGSGIFKHFSETRLPPGWKKNILSGVHIVKSFVHPKRRGFVEKDARKLGGGFAVTDVYRGSCLVNIVQQSFHHLPSPQSL